MGGSSFLFHLAGARLGNNLASQPEAQGQIISEGAPNKIQNPTQKRHPEKSKISILEVVTKNCYAGFGSSWEEHCTENQRFQSRGVNHNVATSSMHVKAEQTNSLIHSSVVRIWLAFHFLAERQTPRYFGKRFTQTLVLLVLD